MDYLSGMDRKPLACALRGICRTNNAKFGEEAPTKGNE
jgi:hypothetical protein